MKNAVAVPLTLAQENEMELTKELAIEEGEAALRLKEMGFDVEPLDPLWPLYKEERARRHRNAH